MHLNSELLFRKHALKHFKESSSVLEIGPSGVPSVYQKIVAGTSIHWDTLELYDTYPGITYVSQHEYKYPVEDNKYDIVVSGQVMEHVKKIWTWLEELKRITKPNGIIIIINPVSWPYHEFPVDCWRIFPEGMKALAETTGLNVIFSEFASLEAEAFKSTFTPTVPGESYTFLDRSKQIHLVRIWNASIHYLPIIKKLKVPVQVAYDTLTIFQKP
jgi:SAM-dependent methyltransferase